MNFANRLLLLLLASTTGAATPALDPIEYEMGITRWEQPVADPWKWAAMRFQIDVGGNEAHLRTFDLDVNGDGRSDRIITSLASHGNAGGSYAVFLNTAEDYRFIGYLWLRTFQVLAPQKGHARLRTFGRIDTDCEVAVTHENDGAIWTEVSRLSACENGPAFESLKNEAPMQRPELLWQTNADQSPISCGWPNTNIRREDRWIGIETGSDEDRQATRIAIWGSERVAIRCAALAPQAPEHLLIVSRSSGSGPYYRLQIVEFREGAVTHWSYPSQGAPKVEGRRVWLGALEAGFGGASAEPDYSEHAFRTGHGLVGRYEARWWMLLVTLTNEDLQHHVLGAEYPDKARCEVAAAHAAAGYETLGLDVRTECRSNADVQRSLDPLIN